MRLALGAPQCPGEAQGTCRRGDGPGLLGGSPRQPAGCSPSLQGAPPPPCPTLGTQGIILPVPKPFPALWDPSDEPRSAGVSARHTAHTLLCTLGSPSSAFATQPCPRGAQPSPRSSLVQACGCLEVASQPPWTQRGPSGATAWTAVSARRTGTGRPPRAGGEDTAQAWGALGAAAAAREGRQRFPEEGAGRPARWAGSRPCSTFCRGIGCQRGPGCSLHPSSHVWPEAPGKAPCGTRGGGHGPRTREAGAGLAPRCLVPDIDSANGQGQ